MNEPPKRRRFQFRLRTLLIFTAILGICFGLLGRKVGRKQNEDRAVETIRKLGGTVFYSYQQDKVNKDMWHQTEEADGPAWLRWALGNNFFSEIELVVFWHANIGDPELESLKDSLKEFPQLRHLDLQGTKVTDSELARIKLELPRCEIFRGPRE
jgi:hypothetical protein